MASLMCRTTGSLARRSILLLSARASSGGTAIDPQKGKVAVERVDMPDTLGHAVGPERFELLARIAGNEDPFEMNVQKRAKGTSAEPTEVASMYDKRLVGCICEEDSIAIRWMHLNRGSPRRCHCGYWFKLTDLNAADFGQ